MSVVINETNFPDSGFRNYVSQYWDLDGDGVLSSEEIAAVTSFYCRPDQYHNYWFNVKGLEYFTNLESIDTSGPNYSDTNFAAFPKLQAVSISDSRTSLSDIYDFRGCSSLTSVTLLFGSINRIYFGANIVEASITQYGQYAYHNVNPTATFDFTDSVLLQDVTFNGLGWINDPHDEINEVSISGLTNKSSLRSITIQQCQCFMSLDFSNDANLINLSCTDCDNLRSLNISGCTALESLICSNCDLRPSLDLQPMTALRTLDVSRTSLSSLLLGAKPNLSVLRCCTAEDKIAIQELDLNGCPLIKHKMFMGESYAYNYYGDHLIHFTGNNDKNLVAKDPSQNKIAYDHRTMVLPVSVTAVEGERVPFDLEDIWHNLKMYDADTEERVGYFYLADYSKNGKKYYFLDESEYHSAEETWVNDPDNPGVLILNPEINWADIHQATSLTFELTVLQRPVINTQPQSVSVANGCYAVFSIAAMDPNGGELTYQWERSADNGESWLAIQNDANSSVYRDQVSTDFDGYKYRCVVASSVASVASDSASVSVVIATFQWQVSYDSGLTWIDLFPNGDNSTYSFVAAKSDSGKQYRCIATNAAGSGTSNPATLTVYDPPAIVSRSTIQECIAEGTEVTLSVTASGDNLQYQWQANQNGEWTGIENATDPSYTFTAAREDTGKRFQCYIYNVVGNVTCEIYDDPEHLASGATSITVVYQPNIADQTITSPVQTGNEAVLTVLAEGGRLNYQWQVSSDNGENWENIDGAVSNPYSFTATKADSGKQYRCHVTNLAGNTDSLSEMLTVLDPPVINSALSVPLIADGATVTLTVNASGDDLHYQWQSSSDNAVWTDILDASEETYTFTADTSQNHTFYRYRVWNSVNEAVSNAAELVVVTKPNVTTPPESQILAVGSQATFSVSASGEALDCHWQVSSDDGETWIDIPDAAEDNYSFTASKADSGKQYRYHVENIAGEAVSEAASLTVLFSPVVLTSSDVDEFISEGTSVTLEAVASGDELRHKWYVKYGDVDQWYPIEAGEDSQYADLTVSEQTPYLEDDVWHSGEKKVSLTFTAAKELSGNQYRCEFSNDVGSVFSAATNTLVVMFEPRITQIISPVNAVRNGDPVSLAVIAEGGNLSYQWTVSTDNGESWENIADSGNDSTYSFIATVSQNDYLYACTVTNLAGSCTSDPISFVVQVPPSVSQSPASAIVGNNATATFHATFDGTQLHYQWQVSSDNGATWIELENTDSDTYSFTASIEKDGHLYRCRATNDLGFVTTGSALLTILTYPAIITQPSSASVDYASNVVFLVSATGGNLFYQWQYSSNNGATWKNVTKNGTNATYSFLAADTQNGYLYRCLVANNIGSVTSNAATLTVIGSATSEDETADLVYPGKYLPSQMAAMIRNLPVGVDLDNIRFGNESGECLHAAVGNRGSTDPENYEKIAKAINELKLLIRQMQG